MSILSIKQELLLPEKETVLNKKLNIRQKPALIASITEQKGIVKLWVFQQIPDSPLANTDMEPMECVTNRDEIWKRASRANVSWGYISDIAIQGIALPIAQASGGVVQYDPMMYMKLQHFIETGVDFSSMENIGFDELILCVYQLEEGTDFPKIDTKAEMPVSLTIRGETSEALIEPSHWYSLKTGEQDISRSFRNPATGDDIVYYIDSIISYDIWGETAERMSDDKTFEAWREHGLDEASIERARATWQESVERVCPKGEELLILHYECIDNHQLNF